MSSSANAGVQLQQECPRELRTQAVEMLGAGRGHAQTVLTRLGALLDSLAEMRAPKHLVLFSGRTH